MKRAKRISVKRRTLIKFRSGAIEVIITQSPASASWRKSARRNRANWRRKDANAYPTNALVCVHHDGITVHDIDAGKLFASFAEVKP